MVFDSITKPLLRFALQELGNHTACMRQFFSIGATDRIRRYAEFSQSLIMHATVLFIIGTFHRNRIFLEKSTNTQCTSLGCTLLGFSLVPLLE